MSRRLRLATLAATAALATAGIASGAPLTDHAGTPIPATDTAGRLGDAGAAADDPIRVAAGGAQVLIRSAITQVLGTPDAAAQPVGTGSPNSPEEDLADALDALAAAATPADVAAARQKALDILEGNTAAGACPPSLATPPRAYCGIPLLNWQPAKLQVVPAGGTITVRVVRFGEHEITDTSQLQFADPNQPFSITYLVSELGGSDGGDLSPTPLLADGGGPVGGLHSAIVSLAQREEDLGSTQSSRFTDHLLLPAQPEHTSIVTQSVTVAMPPPRYVRAILSPNLRQGHEALSTLFPSSQGALSPNVAAGAAKISNAAPEKQIWNALNALPADVPGAKAVGAQLRGGVMPLMRVRTQLPPGVPPPAGASVTVAIENAEAYVSSTRVRLAPGGALHLGIVNRDPVARTFTPAALFNRRFTEGANQWGQFDWTALTPVVVPPAGSTVVTITPPADAFALWVADQAGGDQAGAAIELDRDPVIEAFKIPPPAPASAAPLHVAIDDQGRVYATLAGFDRIVRITPGSGPLAKARYEEFLIPQQHCLPPLPNAPLVACGPSDIGIDKHGIIWATLAIGNAMLRFDPPRGQPGSAAGMTVYPLAPCTPVLCREPPPPAVPGPLSRNPLQMDISEDKQGNTLVWFSEFFADAIGVIRVSPTGKLVGASDFGCDCVVQGLPTGGEAPVGARPVGGLGGVAVDRLKRVWYAEGAAGRIGLVTPNAANPTAPPRIEHFDLPFHPPTRDFDLGPGLFNTSFPHSVTIDPQGHVWATEQQPSVVPSGDSLTKLAELDPAAVAPNTTNGITEIPVARNDFGQLVQMADLTSDAAGTIFVADEYGDQITAVRAGQGVVGKWRTVRRQSLTDQPTVDAEGNLWYLEVGANLIVRIKGIITPVKLTALQRACKQRNWIWGPKAKPRMLLLGNTAAQVRSCIGEPTKRSGRGANQKWRYGKQIEVRFRGNRVAGFTLLDRTYRTASSGVGVSTTLARLRGSRPKAVLELKARRYRSVVAIAGGRVAVVRYQLAGGKVRRIVVDVRTRKQLKAIISGAKPAGTP